jgi:hypothetical protein
VCFGLNGDLGEKRGQIAHLDQNPVNNSRDNLVYLCFDHHDQYDGQTSQSKGLSAAEIRKYRADLYNRVRAGIKSTQSSTPTPRVVSYNQRGGITAETVKVDAAPEPELQARPLFLNRQEGGRFHSRFELEVVSPYPPANLRLVVHASTIQDMQLAPQRSGIAMFGHSGKREGYCFTNLHNPAGSLHLDVFTAGEEKFEVEYDFN